MANSETERQRNGLTERTDKEIKYRSMNGRESENNKNNATRQSEVRLEQRRGACSMQRAQWRKKRDGSMQRDSVRVLSG